jgi:DNA replication and repair protein RecF
MLIESLKITDFRILTDVSLRPSSGLNLIWGDNGAGKTSILEALYLAARGRSFRHQEAGPFIRTGASKARVVVKTQDEMGRHHVLGIERSAREQLVRLDGTNLQRRSEQVRALPLQILTPNSHALIEGPPELRRRYLDLGLFHVEQAYHRWYSDYQRALRQRNAALRTQPRTAATWDHALAEAAILLHQSRDNYIRLLAEAAEAALLRMTPGIQISLVHRPGWDPDTELSAQLASRFEMDCRQGFTGIGPHRADIQIRAEHVDAAKRLSRGQQKLVVIALMLGQVAVQQSKISCTPVLLLDDLPAELDRTHRERVMTELRSLSAQALITSVEPDSLPMGSGAGMFHVEQGGRLAG